MSSFVGTVQQKREFLSANQGRMQVNSGDTNGRSGDFIVKTQSINQCGHRFRTHLWAERLEARWTPAAGALDPTFSLDGIQTLDIGAASDFARQTVLQADGKILIAGTSSLGGGNSAFSVARYTTAGTLDPSFDI